MDENRLRSKLISIAVMLIGVLLSGLFFFLAWAVGEQNPWYNLLMPLSFAAFLGSAAITFIIQFGLRVQLERSRVIGFMLVIVWIGASLLSTTLETLRIMSAHLARGISYVIVAGGLIVLVIPGFLLMLFPWPPRLRKPPAERPSRNRGGS